MRLSLIIVATGALLLSGIASAADIKVLSTQATEEAYKELLPQFEKTSGHKVSTLFTGTLDVNKRLAAGETYDLIIMSAASIDEHIKGGKIEAGSRVDLAKSGIGAAVKKGARKPDIRTVDALKDTMLAVKSIGYSTGPSGIYMVNLFQRLGIADAVKDKLKQTPTGVFVGNIIASGEAEIGFQQVSELLHFPGVDYISGLPLEVQHYTTFSAGIQVGAKEVEPAKALVKFLIAPTATPAFKKRGMERE